MIASSYNKMMMNDTNTLRWPIEIMYTVQHILVGADFPTALVACAPVERLPRKCECIALRIIRPSNILILLIDVLTYLFNRK